MSAEEDALSESGVPQSDLAAAVAAAAAAAVDSIVEAGTAAAARMPPDCKEGRAAGDSGDSAQESR